jgi:beta-lactam-binding protein with PASTA domain/tRNA A-37 threonylcarbamoyl transferase component Bud32
MSNFAEGKILDKKYEILGLIGSGGMAYVYKARDIKTGNFVAIKVLKREYCDNESYIKRFNNEAAAVRNLVHPNIVQIYDVGNVGNVHYITREYVEGITLKDYIERKASIPWDEALSIAQQLLKAVEAAHAQHVIHRDIKPMNVLITKDGTIKLSDFGIAKAVLGATIEATKNSMGSVHYISPEQARGGFVDERSDIYSIGVTLYEMVVGVVPFDGDSHVSIALKHLSGTFIPPHDADPEIPMGINDLIVMAMRKDPGARFQTATDMLSRLARVAEDPDQGFLEDACYDDDSDMKVVEDDGSVTQGVPGQPEEQLSEDGLGEDNIEISVAPAKDIEKQNEYLKKKELAFKIGSYGLAAIASILLAVFVIKSVSYVIDKSYLLSKATYTLGNYQGYEAVPIIEMLEEEDIFVEQILKEDDNYLDAGYIISQDLEPGKIMRKGDVVTFTVSAKEGSFLVPDCRTYTYQEAVETFTQLGMQTETVYVKNNETPVGLVVKTSPVAGAVVTKDEIMTIYVSEGELYNEVTVPNLEGKTFAEAKAELEALGLKVGTSYPDPGQNITYILHPTPSPTPSPLPTLKPTPEPTERPTEEPTPEPTEEPEETPGEEDGDEEDPFAGIRRTPKPSPTKTPKPTATPKPSPSPTPKPTRRPTASPSPLPTLSPRDYVYASETVVYQYPPAGTTLYKNETVDLYFYDISNSRLDPLRKYKTVSIAQPVGLGNKSSITFAVYATPNDTGKRETVYNKTIYTSLFPLNVKIPVSYSGGTNVAVYVNNKLYCEYLIW